MSETNAQTDQATPHPALKRLDALIGAWNTEWWATEEPGATPVKVTGSDTYTWQEGGFFVLHDVVAHMDYGDYIALEIIGPYDEASDSYEVRSFDSQGAIQTMKARVDDDGVWTFAGDSTRATLVVNEDGQHMSAKWQRQNDSGDWQHWLDMKFTK